MTRTEYINILSEKTELEKMLAQMPQTEVINRLSLQARLDEVNSELSQQIKHK